MLYLFKFFQKVHLKARCVAANSVSVAVCPGSIRPGVQDPVGALTQ